MSSCWSTISAKFYGCQLWPVSLHYFGWERQSNFPQLFSFKTFFVNHTFFFPFQTWSSATNSCEPNHSGCFYRFMHHFGNATKFGSSWKFDSRHFDHRRRNSSLLCWCLLEKQTGLLPTLIVGHRTFLPNHVLHHIRWPRRKRCLKLLCIPF